MLFGKVWSAFLSFLVAVGVIFCCVDILCMYWWYIPSLEFYNQCWDFLQLTEQFDFPRGAYIHKVPDLTRALHYSSSTIYPVLGTSSTLPSVTSVNLSRWLHRRYLSRHPFLTVQHGRKTLGSGYWLWYRRPPATWFIDIIREQGRGDNYNTGVIATDEAYPTAEYATAGEYYKPYSSRYKVKLPRPLRKWKPKSRYRYWKVRLLLNKIFFRQGMINRPRLRNRSYFFVRKLFSLRKKYVRKNRRGLSGYYKTLKKMRSYGPKIKFKFSKGSTNRYIRIYKNAFRNKTYRYPHDQTQIMGLVGLKKFYQKRFGAVELLSSKLKYIVKNKARLNAVYRLRTPYESHYDQAALGGLRSTLGKLRPPDTSENILIIDHWRSNGKNWEYIQDMAGKYGIPHHEYGMRTRGIYHESSGARRFCIKNYGYEVPINYKMVDPGLLNFTSPWSLRAGRRFTIGKHDGKRPKRYKRLIKPNLKFSASRTALSNALRRHRYFRLSRAKSKRTLESFLKPKETFASKYSLTKKLEQFANWKKASARALLYGPEKKKTRFKGRAFRLAPKHGYGLPNAFGYSSGQRSRHLLHMFADALKNYKDPYFFVEDHIKRRVESSTFRRVRHKKYRKSRLKFYMRAKRRETLVRFANKRRYGRKRVQYRAKILPNYMFFQRKWFPGISDRKSLIDFYLMDILPFFHNRLTVEVRKELSDAVQAGKIINFKEFFTLRDLADLPLKDSFLVTFRVYMLWKGLYEIWFIPGRLDLYKLQAWVSLHDNVVMPLLLRGIKLEDGDIAHGYSPYDDIYSGIYFWARQWEKFRQSLHALPKFSGIVATFKNGLRLYDRGYGSHRLDSLKRTSVRQQQEVWKRLRVLYPTIFRSLMSTGGHDFNSPIEDRTWYIRAPKYFGKVVGSVSPHVGGMDIWFCILLLSFRIAFVLYIVYHIISWFCSKYLDTLEVGEHRVFVVSCFLMSCYVFFLLNWPFPFYIM